MISGRDPNHKHDGRRAHLRAMHRPCKKVRRVPTPDCGVFEGRDRASRRCRCYGIRASRARRGPRRGFAAATSVWQVETKRLPRSQRCHSSARPRGAVGHGPVTQPDADNDRHRPSPGDFAARRPHLRARPRAHRRCRHARRTGRPWRPGRAAGSAAARHLRQSAALCAGQAVRSPSARARADRRPSRPGSDRPERSGRRRLAAARAVPGRRPHPRPMRRAAA